MRFTTDVELAEALGMSVDAVRRNCPSDGSGWPHLRPRRSVWRFTDDQVEQILAEVAVKPKAAQPSPAKAAIPGQTAGSRKRSA